MQAVAMGDEVETILEVKGQQSEVILLQFLHASLHSLYFLQWLLRLLLQQVCGHLQQNQLPTPVQVPPAQSVGGRPEEIQWLCWFYEYFLFSVLHSMSKLAMFLLSLAVAAPLNYIVNGDFSSPAIVLNTIIRNTISGWNGTYFDIDNHAANLGFGQFIDLQGLYYQNGYIEQYISLPTEGFYVLSLYQKSINTLYNNHVMQIHWNGALQSTKTPNTTNVTFETMVLFGLVGVNILKFTEIGIDADYYGMFID